MLDLLMEKVIIVGSGCAGLDRGDLCRAREFESAGAGRPATRRPALDHHPGRKFPGFPEGIDGPQLIMNMHEQAEKFGARFSYAEVDDFDREQQTHSDQSGR